MVLLRRTLCCNRMNMYENFRLQRGDYKSGYIERSSFRDKWTKSLQLYKYVHMYTLRRRGYFYHGVILKTSTDTMLGNRFGYLCGKFLKKQCQRRYSSFRNGFLRFHYEHFG